MSKLTKLKNNPKLFFKDMVNKRIRFSSYSKNNNISAPLTLSNQYDDSRVKTKKFLESKIEKKIIKSSNAQDFFINNYYHIDVNYKQILFASNWGRKIGCNPYALYREFISRREFQYYTFIWVKNSGVEVPDDVLDNPRVRFVEQGSLKYAEELLRSHILITNSTFPHYFSPKPEQYLVNTWHGVPYKTMGFNEHAELENIYNSQRNFNISDLILSASPYFTHNVVEAFGATFGLSKVFESGSPRIDLTYASNSSELREQLNIPEGRKILLYAPTWRGDPNHISSDINSFLLTVNFLKTRYSQDFEIYLSVHHYTLSQGNIKLPNDIKIVPPSLDINKFLSICDVLISDYSSIFIDFLVLDRPVILYTPDYTNYSTTRGLYLSRDELPVQIANTLYELDQELKTPIPPSSKANYKDFLQKVIPHDSNSLSVSSKVVDKIMVDCNKIKKSNKPSLNKKESILFLPGGFSTNGITTSAINFLDNLDYDKFDVYLLVDIKEVGKTDEKFNNLLRMNSNCHWLLTSWPKYYTKAERSAHNNMMSPEPSEKDYKLVNASFLRETRRLFGKNSFDYIIDFSGYSRSWPYLCANTNAKKKIIFLHNDLHAEYTNPNRKQKQLMAVFNSYKYFDKLISVSSELSNVNSKNLCKYSDIHKFDYLTNFITPSKIQKLSNEDVSVVCPAFFINQLVDNSINFVVLGRLSPEKNHASIIDAFRLLTVTLTLTAPNIKAKLTIIGDGPLRDELESKVVQNNLENLVLFTGMLENPFPVLANSDCLLLYSHYEGQPMVLNEAMSLGVFCIGSDIPGITPVITPYNGVVTSLNTVDLAKLLLEFCKNRSKYHISYDANKYVSSVNERLYNEILTLN